MYVHTQPSTALRMTLPFAGPISALVAMLGIIAAAAPAMMG